MPIVGKPRVPAPPALKSPSKTLAEVRPALSSGDLVSRRLETLAQKRSALSAAGEGVESTGHGGERAGAGRPLTDPAGALVRVTLSVSPRHAAYLDSEAERLGVNRSAVIRSILNRMR